MTNETSMVRNCSKWTEYESGTKCFVFPAAKKLERCILILVSVKHRAYSSRSFLESVLTTMK